MTTASILNKGDEADLAKIDPGLRKAVIAAGWDAPKEVDTFPVDIDLSAFLLNRDGRARRPSDFVFYNNLETEKGAVRHKGDCTTGDGDGDDETVEIDLEGVPFDVEKIAFSVSLHNADERHQTFGLVKNAFIRIVNLETKQEVARFNLTEEAASDSGVVFGELFRDGAAWKFRAVAKGSPGGLYRIAKDFGLNVAPT